MSTVNDINSGLIGCICAIDGNCTSHAGFYNSSFMMLSEANNAQLVYKIRGLVSGCSPMKSLLLSTLECFYSDSDCFSIVLTYVEQAYIWNVVNPDWFDVHPLIYDSTLSRFPPNTSISEIVKDVMIEQWNVSFSYKNFYQTCAPNYCTYTQFIRVNSIIEIIIAFVSMIGGLVVSLRLITPYFVKFVFRSKSTIDEQQQTQGNSILFQKTDKRFI